MSLRVPPAVREYPIVAGGAVHRVSVYPFLLPPTLPLLQPTPVIGPWGAPTRHTCARAPCGPVCAGSAAARPLGRGLAYRRKSRSKSARCQWACLRCDWSAGLGRALLLRLGFVVRAAMLTHPGIGPIQTGRCYYSAGVVVRTTWITGFYWSRLLGRRLLCNINESRLKVRERRMALY